MSDAISWLGALLPGLTPEMEVAIFVNLLPILLLISVAIHILMTFLLPKSGWIRLRARLSRDRVLVQLFGDDGFERTELMKSDLGQGIFSGNPTSYIFTPRPPVIKEGDTELVDLSPDVKANLDEALTHRFGTDTGKPIFIGYVGKSVAVTPKLLKIIKEVHGQKKLKLKKKAEKPKTAVPPKTMVDPSHTSVYVNEEGPGAVVESEEEVEEAPIEVRLLTLLSPLLLKLYIGRTFTKSLIESIKAENERKGFLRKPAPMEFLGRNSIPIVLIILILLVGIAMFSGNLDILGALGMGGATG